MDRQRQDQVIIALKDKGASRPCPRCGNLEFEVIGENMLEIGRWGAEWVVGDPKYKLPAVPVILISCKNCGFIAQHAAGPLGVVR
jgi:ribosomal protein S27AE